MRVFNDRGTCQLHARVTDGGAARCRGQPGDLVGEQIRGRRGDQCADPSRPADMGGGATFYTNLVQVERATCDEVARH